MSNGKPRRIGNIYGEKFGTGYAGNVWDKECLSPALMTMQGGGRIPMIIEYENTETEETEKRGRIQ